MKHYRIKAGTEIWPHPKFYGDADAGPLGGIISTKDVTYTDDDRTPSTSPESYMRFTLPANSKHVKFIVVRIQDVIISE